MKKTVRTICGMILAVLLCLAVSSCGPAVVESSLWETAIHKEDTTLGDGEKQVTVEVKAEEKSVAFTLQTNAEMLDEALLEHGLIAGEKGAYGLYIKVVNGMEADYDKNGFYWSLMQEGEPMMTGVSGVKISGGERFELVCMQ